MQMKSINRLALAGLLAGVLVQGRAETLNGDITAAVREADLTPVITAPAPKGTTPTGGAEPCSSMVFFSARMWFTPIRKADSAITSRPPNCP